MSETNNISEDPTQALINWRGKHGADLAHFIRDLGLPPSEYIGDKMDLRQIGRYVDTAEDAAEKHLKLKNKAGEKEFVIFDATGLQQLSAMYRDSIRGNTEGISTIEIRMKNRGDVNSHPVFHARFMRFNYDRISYLAITGLQRYTDEQLSPVAKPFYTSKELERYHEGKDIKGLTALKEKAPERYREYQKETEDIKRLESVIGVKLPEVAIATCAALAKACGDQKLLLTTYNNQVWFKIHSRALDRTEVPNVYDSSAQLFGLPFSTNIAGFYELDGTKGGITFLKGSRASTNIQLNAIAQRAYTEFSEKLR